MSGGRASPPPLPGVLAEIEEIAGRAAALALAASCGGRQIYIAAAAGSRGGAALAAHIGEDAAHAVAARLAGSVVYIPLARRARAAHLAAEGHGAPAIARRLGIARRTVRRYLRAAER